MHWSPALLKYIIHNIIDEYQPVLAVKVIHLGSITALIF